MRFSALPNTKSARCVPTITDTCPPMAPLSSAALSTMRCSYGVVDRPIGVSADHDAGVVPNSNANATPVMHQVALMPRGLVNVT
jgi:hypothetical protein